MNASPLHPQLRPLTRCLLHAALFVVVLGGLWLLGGWIDHLPEVKGSWLDPRWYHLLMDIGLAITMAVSLNLILGLTGQFSLGHGGFMAAGAYTAAVLAGLLFEPQLRFWIGTVHLSTTLAFSLIMLTGVLAGALLAALLEFIVGLPALRLRGDYLAIATLGFSEILVVVVENFRVDTGNGNQFDLGLSTGLSLTSTRNEWLAIQPDPEAPLAKAVQAYMDNTTYFVSFF